MARTADEKFKERASVMFGRPSARSIKLRQQAAAGQSVQCFSCFGGVFNSLTGFPEAEAVEGATYAEPQQLEPLTPCASWKELGKERKTCIRHLEVGSAAKECSSGWINQDATAACAAPGNGEALGDQAAGAVCDGSLFFCVFDGHGKVGHEVAGIAAERLPAHLAAATGGPLANPTKALEEAFRKADDDIYAKLGPRVEYSGSTGVAVIMDPAQRVLHVGNVGDSRAVLGSCSDAGGGVTNWHARPLTEDLKPDLPGERSRIELSGGVIMALEGDDGGDVGPARVWESGAREKPGLAVSRSLGDGASRCLGVIAEPVVTTRQLQVTDRFMLIATDGLWDTLGNDQAVKICAMYLERNLPHVAVKALLEAVRREEGGQLVDDTTVILVAFA